MTAPTVDELLGRARHHIESTKFRILYSQDVHYNLDEINLAIEALVEARHALAGAPRPSDARKPLNIDLRVRELCDEHGYEITGIEPVNIVGPDEVDNDGCKWKLLRVDMARRPAERSPLDEAITQLEELVNKLGNGSIQKTWRIFKRTIRASQDPE